MWGVRGGREHPPLTHIQSNACRFLFLLFIYLRFAEAASFDKKELCRSDTPGTRKVFRHWNVKVSFHEPLDFFGIWEGKTISRGDEKNGPVLQFHEPLDVFGIREGKTISRGHEKKFLY